MCGVPCHEGILLRLPKLQHFRVSHIGFTPNIRCVWLTAVFRGALIDFDFSFFRPPPPYTCSFTLNFLKTDAIIEV